MKFSSNLKNSPDYPNLQYFKLCPEAFSPEWGTEHAACFDLKACLVLGTLVTAFEPNNEKIKIIVYQEQHWNPDSPAYITVNPGQRVMVPTGLTFNIPISYSVRLHSRSGWAVKQGIVLANHEGIIDSDYVDPTYMVVTNNSNEIATIKHGDRLAQAEMVPDKTYNLSETLDKPLAKSDRVGGFGSTGNS